MRRLAVTIAVALAVTLAACSGGEKEVDTSAAAIVPARYKEEIIASLPQIANDIDGARDALITDPALTDVGKSQVYFVCVRVNLHIAAQGYLGNNDLVAYFLGGKINQLIKAPPERCAKAVYKPFPELNKYCRGATCR